MASFENSTYFTKAEFRHPEKMHQELVAMLDVARGIARVPFVITSDWRPEGDGKSHHLGKAVDIRCKTAADRCAIVNGLLRAGFSRIGVYYGAIEDGHHVGGHVHADINSEEDGFPQDVMWISKSRS